MVEFLVDAGDVSVDGLADASRLQCLLDAEFLFLELEEPARTFGIEPYDRGGELAVVRNHESLLDYRMPADFKLDGARAHVLAGACLEEFLDAAREVQEVLVVEESLVAGLEETIFGKRLLVCFGIVVVTDEHAFAPYPDFAVVANFYFEVGEGLADGACLGYARAVRRDYGAAFRHAVALVHGEPDVQEEP